jgi:ornithine decarboxylase
MDITRFPSVNEMLRAWQPSEPVYCIHPDAYSSTANEFLSGFPGRVLYAVKANDHPRVLQLLHQSGIRHFDCASLVEIERVRRNCPGAKCYFMVPLGLRGAAASAYHEHGVRHFMIDHASRLDVLSEEVDLADCVVFARMAVSHDSACGDLSSKFGAPPGRMTALVAGIRHAGAEAALAFNVGTMVTDPDAYRHGLETAAGVLEHIDPPLRLVDIGGGFPRPYPGFPAPEIGRFLSAVREAAARLPLAEGAELMMEPGRALAAPGLSAVVEVLLRKDDRLYLNDGMYGIFWELRFEAHKRYPARAFRNAEALDGATRSFELYGPTCDSSDVLPGRVELPVAIQAGDYIEFSRIGAYSLSGRTDFNGYLSDCIVEIDPGR